MENFDQTQLAEGEYDLIPYACSDGYDTIEEVDIKDDILVNNVPPRLGPLPSPNYSVLVSMESRPPGVYSRMMHKEYSDEDKENDIGWNEQHTDPKESTSGQPQFPETGGSTRIHSYLFLETNVCNGSATVAEAYLRERNDALENKSGSSVYEATQRVHSIGKPTVVSSLSIYADLVTTSCKAVEELNEETGEDGYEIPSDKVPSHSLKVQSYSAETIYESTQKEDDSRRKLTLDSINHAELRTKPHEEIGEDGYEIPSDNIMMTEDCGSGRTTMNNPNRLLMQNTNT